MFVSPSPNTKMKISSLLNHADKERFETSPFSVAKTMAMDVVHSLNVSSTKSLVEFERHLMSLEKPSAYRFLADMYKNSKHVDVDLGKAKALIIMAAFKESKLYLIESGLAHNEAEAAFLLVA